MNIFEFGWTGFWDPYIRWCGLIQLGILISNIFILYRYFCNHFFAKKKVKEIQKIPVGDEELRSLIENKFGNNVKYYIITKICSKFLLNDLTAKRSMSISHQIKISENPESIIESQITYKNYLILTVGVSALFVFALFLIFISVFCLPYLFSNIDLKDYPAHLFGPFQLFVLTSVNFFTSIWTFIKSQKFAKYLSIITRELEFLLKNNPKKVENNG